MLSCGRVVPTALRPRGFDTCVGLQEEASGLLTECNVVTGHVTADTDHWTRPRI